MRMLVMLAYLSLMPISFSVGAADLAGEQRLAGEIIDSIIGGDPVYLTIGEHELLSICTEAEEPRGALAMMHGRSFQPNRSDGLAEQGL